MNIMDKKGGRATEGALADLHGAFALHLMERLRGGEATASDLGVIRQFLRDNNINCVGEANDTLKELAASLPDFDYEESEEYSSGGNV